jgi:hypothetical protein
MPSVAMEVAGEIESRSNQEGLHLVDMMLAAIDLQAQKGLLNQIVGVVGVVSPATQQATEF